MTFISAAEVAKHTTPNDCWIIIKGSVYNVSDFLQSHPGGSKVILRYAGKDATVEFEPIHPENAMDALPKGTFLGTVDPTYSTSVSGSPISTKKTSSGIQKKGARLNQCLSLRDFEHAAEKLLTPRAFAYFKGAADDEYSVNWNEKSFSLIKFRPRILVNVETVDPSTTIMGHKVSLPFLIAPAAMAKQAHPDGEIALLRAAAKFNIGQGICTNASYSFTTLASPEYKSPSQLLFYQVYINKDRDITVRNIRLAKELGYKGLLLTVDAPIVGKRERDERVNIIDDDDDSDGGSEGGTLQAGVQGLAKASSGYFDIRLCWDDIAWLRSIADMPIAIKGIQTAEDAAECAIRNCHVYLSNHGGRQLDTAPASIETLLEIRKHCPWVLKKVEVYLDGGVRRGTDVLKALALGAKAVFIGRPFLYSLAFGQLGAEKLCTILVAEIMTAMRLLGVTNIKDLGDEYVNTGELDHIISKTYRGRTEPRTVAKL